MTIRRNMLVGLGAAALIALPLLAAERAPRATPECRADQRAPIAAPCPGTLAAQERRSRELAGPGARREERREGGGAAASALAPQTLAYGSDPLQQLDLWVPARTTRPAPLVLFVHGGGWQRGSKDNAVSRAMPGHMRRQGYAFASINYRLVPQASVEQQAADVAAALAYLLARADSLGIDRSRVVLTGHSAGAHLVALVGTDERYLRAAGLSFADIDGVMPNDGAAYDVAAQMKDAGPMMRRTYTQAFGTDPARQRELSPMMHATAPNAPAFLLIHVQRADGVAQNQALGAALRRAGTAVEIGSFPGEGLRGHMEINRKLGEPDYPATPVMDAWLKRVFRS